MSTVDYYEQGFKKSCENANKLVEEIRKKISLYEPVDNRKRSNYCNVVFRAICRAISANAKFFDIYCGILFQHLLPNIHPASGWNGFLKCLKFFHAELCQINRLDDASELVKWIASKDLGELLQAPDTDFRPLFTIFCRNFFNQCNPNKTSSDCLLNVSNLLEEICRRTPRINISQLLEDFRTNIFGSERCMKTLAELPATSLGRTAVFDAFFRAISMASFTECKSDNDAKLLYIEVLKLLKILIQFDIMNAATTSNAAALNYLRVCKGLEIWDQYGKHCGYILSLLFHYQKLWYNPTDQIKENLPIICSKMSAHLDKFSTCTEIWSMETIVIFARILSASSASANGSMIHEKYWEQMDDACYLSKQRLMEKMVKMASIINFGSGSVFSCCNSDRKHLIFLICQQDLELYLQYIKNCKAKGYQAEKEIEISNGLHAIVKHTVAVANTMKCTLVPNTVANIAYYITNIGQQANTKIQARCCWKMTEAMFNIRNFFSQNLWRKLIYSLIKPVRTAGIWQKEAEAYAINAALTMLSSSTEDLHIARRFITLYYQMETPPEKSLVELLDHCTSPLKTIGYDRRTLHTLETNIVLKKNDANILVFTSLLKYCENPLDFILFIKSAPNIDIFSEVENIYTQLKKKFDANLLTNSERLAWGHVSKWLFAHNIEKMSKQFASGVKYNDENLQKLFDEEKSKIQKMNIANEQQIIRQGVDAVEAFEKFYQSSDIVQETCVDWEAILDDLSFVARWLQFRGYIGFACRAWLLLYRIADTIQDLLNQIRALSFILDESQVVHFYDPNFNFKAEIQRLSLHIFNFLLDLENLTPRRQNYVLLCICNLAKYYTTDATKESYFISQILLDLVEEKIEELPSRRDQYDLVKAKHNATVFHLECIFTCRKKRSPLQYVDRIIERLRAIAYVTSEDSVNYPLLLFNLIEDLAHFMTNRLIDTGLSPYFQMIIKLALDFGASLRIVNILAMWAHVQIQSEEVEKAQIKLRLIDCFLQEVPDELPIENDKEKFFNIAKESHEMGKEKANNLQICKTFGSIDSLRKVLPVMLSPIKTEKLTVSVQNLHIGRYLLSSPELDNPLLNWLNFETACLNARILYLIEDHSSLEQFYLNAVDWCNQHSKDIGKSFRQYEIKSLIQFINYLRYTKKLNMASDFIEITRKKLEIFDKNLDKVYQINLWNQQQSLSEEEEVPLDFKNVFKKSRRALEYDSPENMEKSKKSKAESSSQMQGIVDSQDANRLGADFNSYPPVNVSPLSSNQGQSRGVQCQNVEKSLKAVHEVFSANNASTKKKPKCDKNISPNKKGKIESQMPNEKKIELTTKSQRKKGIRFADSPKREDKSQISIGSTKKYEERIMKQTNRSVNIESLLLSEAGSMDVVVFSDSPEAKQPVNRNTQLKHTGTLRTSKYKPTSTLVAAPKAETTSRTTRLGLRRQRSELTS